MTLHGQRPFISVLLNGHPATFLIDTGATSTIIDSETPDEGLGVNVVSLQIGDLRFPRLQAARETVRQFTETNIGARADGVIGQDLLSHYPVALDFPNRTLTIYRTSSAAGAALQPGSVVTGLRVFDGKPLVAASLDGQGPIWFSLGTGAASEVELDSASDHASRYERAEHSLPYSEARLAGDFSGKIVRAHALSIGSLTFNQPLIVLSNSRRDRTSGGPAGVLGSAVLSRLGLLIDEPSGTAQITAPPSATWATLYNSSGVDLVMRRDAIVVRSVMPGTPAAQARLHPGDEIIAINGLEPATLDFAQQLLVGNPGTKVTISYRRWRLVHKTSLTLRVLI